MSMHPRDALFDPDELQAPALPVYDHHSGVEPRMRKSLALQAERGPVFDVMLDGEDGAPVGGEIEHAALIAELVNGPDNRFGRVGARVLPVVHPRFEPVVDLLLQRAGEKPAGLMIPKPRGLAGVQRATAAVDDAACRHGIARAIRLHTLIETHGALREVQAIAAQPHGGQFDHPLVLRAKPEIAAAGQAFGKVPRIASSPS